MIGPLKSLVSVFIYSLFKAACKRTLRVGNGEQTDATTPNNVGTCSASWERYNP